MLHALRISWVGVTVKAVLHVCTHKGTCQEMRQNRALYLPRDTLKCCIFCTYKHMWYFKLYLYFLFLLGAYALIVSIFGDQQCKQRCSCVHVYVRTVYPLMCWEHYYYYYRLYSTTYKGLRTKSTYSAVCMKVNVLRVWQKLLLPALINFSKLTN